MTQNRERHAAPRHFLMCPPEHFDVVYAINPWMDTTVPVDTGRAIRQWTALKDAYEARGHTVDVIDSEPGLPDMVYAANGGIVVGGQAIAARFAYPERAKEGPAYDAWFTGPAARARGIAALGQSGETQEGEGDLLLIGSTLLAGHGFRTTRAAHEEAARRLGLAEQGIGVVPLELVDPRYYHLDTALAVLDDGAGGNPPLVAYLPGAFAPESRAVLERMFPGAIIASDDDAAVLGLNVVSDGRTVFLTDRAGKLAEDIAAAGFDVVGVDLSELFKGGGSVKCCTLELRPGAVGQETSR
ncbi:dimethylargininase [Myceligenerans crystallogenes]|uniref:Arginine deiminase-related protein n=1 Tax=Myceligenerans crystallogenes TaxID=316335 RepID=A0ABP4ZKJ5_9MICO